MINLYFVQSYCIFTSTYYVIAIFSHYSNIKKSDCAGSLAHAVREMTKEFILFMPKRSQM